MKTKTLNIAYIALVLLTIASSFLSRMNAMAVVAIVAILALMKYLWVGFEFMDLKGAHFFWKFFFVLYGVLITFFFIVLLI